MDLEQLTKKLAQIRQECGALDENILEAKAGQIPESYMEGHFLYTESLFSAGRTLLQQADAEPAELEQYQNELDQLYRHFLTAKGSYMDSDEEMEEELAEEMEEPSEELPEENDEQLPPVFSAIPSKQRKKKKRVIYKPQLPTEPTVPPQSEEEYYRQRQQEADDAQAQQERLEEKIQTDRQRRETLRSYHAAQQELYYGSPQPKPSHEEPTYVPSQEVSVRGTADPQPYSPEDTAAVRRKEGQVLSAREEWILEREHQPTRSPDNPRTPEQFHRQRQEEGFRELERQEQKVQQRQADQRRRDTLHSYHAAQQELHHGAKPPAPSYKGSHDPQEVSDRRTAEYHSLNPNRAEPALYSSHEKRYDERNRLKSANATQQSRPTISPEEVTAARRKAAAGKILSAREEWILERHDSSNSVSSVPRTPAQFHRQEEVFRELERQNQKVQQRQSDQRQRKTLHGYHAVSQTAHYHASALLPTSAISPKTIQSRHLEQQQRIWNHQPGAERLAQALQNPIHGAATPEQKTAHVREYGQFTQAEQAVIQHNKPRQPVQTYRLAAVTQRIGGTAYSLTMRLGQRAAGKADNDAVNAFLTGSYYVSAAYSAARIPFSRSASAPLRSGAERVTGDQFIAQRKSMIHEKREIRSQIATLQHQLGKLTDPRSAEKAEKIRSKISNLTTQSAALDLSIRKMDWVVQRIHHQQWDQELVRVLSVKNGGKIPTDPRSLQELTGTYLAAKERQIMQRMACTGAVNASGIAMEIEKLKTYGQHLKKQLRILQNKPTLTASERTLLMNIRGQLKDVGNQVRTLTGLQRSVENLNYLRQRSGQLLQRAYKKRNRRIGTGYLLMGLLLRPVDAGRDSNTEWLSPTTVRAGYMAAKAAGKAAVFGAKLPGKALKTFAPDVDRAMRFYSRHYMNSARSAVSKATPQWIKKSYRTTKNVVTAPARGLRSIKTGIHNAVFRAKQRFAQTKLGMAMAKVTSAAGKVGAVFKTVFLAVKGVLLALLGGLVAFLLIAAVIVSFVSLIVSLTTSSVILSPNSSPDGKFDMTVYAAAVRSEIQDFNSDVDSIRAQYENDPDYDEVDVEYSGANNLREILAMMAVRMEQELDTTKNPHVMPYLAYLVRQSHTYTTDESHYTCSGCEQREVIVMEKDPTTGQMKPVTKLEWYCPGHIDVIISIDVCSLRELFQRDGYPADGLAWDGWTTENQNWVEAILEMDWTELYTGLSPGGGTSIGTIITAADEQKIWTRLKQMTGNAYGAAGLMGNLYAESGLSSINLQNDYEQFLGMDDRTYTAAVDTGTYQSFANDHAGYGIAQWTDSGRKANLLAFAKRRSTSIGNLDMQLDFLATELEGSVLTTLQNASSVRQASDKVLVDFERPADQSDAVKRMRASFGEYFYNKYEKGIASEGNLTEKQIRVIQVATNSDAYGIPADKGYCQAWAAQVYGAAGLEVDGSCCAYHSGMAYGISSDWDSVPPGAAVYGYAGNQYGHVGIYVGNGLVYHNIGGVAIDTLSDWVQYYDGFAWGWLAGEDLTR